MAPRTLPPESAPAGPLPVPDRIASRFPNLVDWLFARGYADPRTPVLARARAADVRDRHVIGNLPVDLASRATTTTGFAFRIAAPHRSRFESYSLKGLDHVFGPPLVYRVTRSDAPADADARDDPHAVIVTRLRPLAEYLKRNGHVHPDAPVLSVATRHHVVDRHAFGVLPLHLARWTRRNTVWNLDLPKTPHTLDVDTIARYVKRPLTFTIHTHQAPARHRHDDERDTP